jgi:hypothetical protein
MENSFGILNYEERNHMQEVEYNHAMCKDGVLECHVFIIIIYQ